MTHTDTHPHTHTHTHTAHAHTHTHNITTQKAFCRVRAVKHAREENMVGHWVKGPPALAPRRIAARAAGSQNLGVRSIVAARWPGVVLLRKEEVGDRAVSVVF